MGSEQRRFPAISGRKRWIRAEAARACLHVECVEADFKIVRLQHRFDLLIQIFTGVLTTDHLARLATKSGLVLRQESYRDAPAVAGFEVVREFRRRPGLQLFQVSDARAASFPSRRT